MIFEIQEEIAQNNLFGKLSNLHIHVIKMYAVINGATSSGLSVFES